MNIEYYEGFQYFCFSEWFFIAIKTCPTFSSDMPEYRTLWMSSIAANIFGFRESKISFIEIKTSPAFFNELEVTSYCRLSMSTSFITSPKSYMLFSICVLLSEFVLALVALLFEWKNHRYFCCNVESLRSCNCLQWFSDFYLFLGFSSMNR